MEQLIIVFHSIAENMILVKIIVRKHCMGFVELTSLEEVIEPEDFLPLDTQDLSSSWHPFDCPNIYPEDFLVEEFSRVSDPLTWLDQNGVNIFGLSNLFEELEQHISWDIKEEPHFKDETLVEQMLEIWNVKMARNISLYKKFKDELIQNIQSCISEKELCDFENYLKMGGEDQDGMLTELSKERRKELNTTPKVDLVELLTTLLHAIYLNDLFLIWERIKILFEEIMNCNSIKELGQLKAETDRCEYNLRDSINLLIQARKLQLM